MRCKTPTGSDLRANACGEKGLAFLSQRAQQIDPNADTFYQLLGIDFRATPNEVARAYRQKMKSCHPDRFPAAQRDGMENLCKQINNAYTVLKDPVKRQQYDRQMRIQEVQDQIMNRYVGGLGGPGINGHDPHAAHLRRQPTAFERAEQRHADRSAMFSLLGVFVLMTAVGIGLLLIFAVLSSVAGLLN